MPDNDTLTLIAEQLGLALRPLETALSSPGLFSSFMLELGWDAATPIADVQNLGALVSDILNTIEDGLDAADAPRIIGDIINLFSAISKLSSATGLPATIDPAEFASDFPGQLLDYLVARVLLNNHPTLGSILLAAGVIRKRIVPKTGKRAAYIRLEIAWDDLGNVLSDPLGIFRHASSWGAAFDQKAFLSNMATLGRGMRSKLR
jgi:hypothetical protein